MISSTKHQLTVAGKKYTIYSLKKLAEQYPIIHELPFSLKVLLENLLRHLDGKQVTEAHIQALINWPKHKHAEADILFFPARILMQDFTGVPAIVDLAAMRDVLKVWGKDPQTINPIKPVDLVIDHSLMADYSGNEPNAFAKNVAIEFQRNQERYSFLKWGQKALQNFRVVPPGTGICHQVNLEYLSQVVWTEKRGKETYAYPDTLFGTDSHTTMVNGLSVLGWGVGGIEAEASMLGEGLSMGIPDVVGVKLTGALQAGVTATDLVLTITQVLRQHGVVNKFVEFYGEGLAHLSLADRATLGNMAPEYGATCAFSPIDAETIRYLELTGRSDQCALVQAYAQHQGLWWDGQEPVYTTTITVDLSAIEPALAGPKRPQDKVTLSQLPASFTQLAGPPTLMDEEPVQGVDYSVRHGDVVIAAITSCTNTSNPTVMIGAGLLAQKAVALGLTIKPWVKTSLAPGSQVVTDYLEAAGLQEPLNKLGFELIGYGCTTCIGNSGPLLPGVEAAVENGDLTVAAALSGNRNFEGRIHRSVKASYLASPLLVVAYAIAGTVKKDLSKEPLAYGVNGQPVYLRDIWPSPKEIQTAIKKYLKPAMFQKRYKNVFKGDAEWNQLHTSVTDTYVWEAKSSYIKQPSFLGHIPQQPLVLEDIHEAKILALFGDSITTDHISPAGSIKADSPAGLYLQQQGVQPEDFNSYGARRGNYEVMVRGTFANIRLQNEMVPDRKGGFTKHMPQGELLSIYDAAMKYQQTGTPTVAVAGKEYGTGSSRDWAAKGTLLLGVRAVIAESFERIHRSNLVGMAVLPLEFMSGQNRKTLQLTGAETFTFKDLAKNLKPKDTISCILRRPNGTTETIKLLVRIDTERELHAYQHGGILPYVLRKYVG